LTVDGDRTHQQQSIRYADLSSPDKLNEFGLSNILGLPEESHFGGLGLVAAMMPVSPAARSASQPVTQIYHDSLVVGGLKQPTFVIESKLNQALWAKIWVSEAGSVLQVDTSMGLTMRSVSIDELETRTTQRAEISQDTFEP
jgi:hypothetical protein